jgi:type IV pilus assembly protein PilV
MKDKPKEHHSNLYMNEKGFTLIEVIIAIVIFSIGILGVGAMHYESIRGNSFAMQITRANNISEDMTEFLKALPYTSDSLGGANPINVQVNKSMTDITDGGVTYRRTWFITQALDSTNNVINDVRIVTVETWWDNDNHHLSFTFYKKI